MAQTYTGSILVAVNPYQLLDIYDGGHIEKYKNMKIGELPPHIFAIADNAYYFMRRDKRDQCCVIRSDVLSSSCHDNTHAHQVERAVPVKPSPPSLFFSTSLLFLASIPGLSSRFSKPTRFSKVRLCALIMSMLTCSNIAFGNAKTIRNDNSSRFGKYIDIHFDQDGVIEGALIEQYLLEKSRIVGQAPNERNYHIFYDLIAGATPAQKQVLGLTKPENFAYLIGGSCTTCNNVNDAEEMSRVLGAMKVLSFPDNVTNLTLSGSCFRRKRHQQHVQHACRCSALGQR